MNTMMNDDVVSPMTLIRDRVAEVRSRGAGDGVALLDGMDAALIGTVRNGDGKLIAVYEEGRLLDIVRARLRSERPESSKDELDADAADLLSDLTRTYPYMGDVGAPIIIEGL